MLSKLAAAGLFAVALLGAQQLIEVERKFYANADEALGLRPGAVIADVGTGHSLGNPDRIAGKVGPNGRVLCVDVKPSIVSDIRAHAASQPLANMDAVLGKEDDPLLAADTYDGILVSNSYHEFTQPSAMLKHFYEALKPNGRLVVLELYSDSHKDDSRADQVKRHDIAPDILERELSAAGFVIKQRIDAVPLTADRCRCLFMAQK
jgi:ubiquinone/menaquinone biosynthesis C-methylase UbiE